MPQTTNTDMGGIKSTGCGGRRGGIGGGLILLAQLISAGTGDGADNFQGVETPWHLDSMQTGAQKKTKPPEDTKRIGGKRADNKE